MTPTAEQMNLMQLRWLVEDLFIEVRDIHRMLRRMECRQEGRPIPPGITENHPKERQ